MHNKACYATILLLTCL